ncbi:hypothetical protein PC116_g24524 [Phytophthora cactorum]|uniref:Uncharacterized protein n=2 Tax=Phytophthora cactorum TaxID=29920 RepID=A0A8T1BBP1_9STRA|nr:hypothetical protein PC117_g22880 [Phytophthora cactorum]KAG2974417.1 hypothetical protein PC119_g22703 [Phytophthora cactorum]KAG2992006.1 hypothetical protein PC120_g22584 [Phytophthora cactorum]KAG3131113.1 hypothetical protein C6341_g23471 [Phytophthora cactorum]KAG4041660.1 hypothetical protein PC123_g22830 [Phytophthora cactorum]
MLAMWAEEVHMLVYLEQESRKPQKAPPTLAVSPTKPTTASPKRSSATAIRSSPKAKSTSTTKTRPAKKQPF